MRTFIAVETPDAFADEVAGISRQLATAVQARFVPRSNYHATLAFLGEIGESEAALAVEALEAACDGHGPVELRADGLGSFGRSNDATLWLGLFANADLVDLANRVRAELEGHGVGYEEKPFRPHVTIARRARLPRAALPDLAFPQPVLADRVTLFRSILDAEGAAYKPLHTVRL